MNDPDPTRHTQDAAEAYNVHLEAETLAQTAQAARDRAMTTFLGTVNGVVGLLGLSLVVWPIVLYVTWLVAR